MEYYYIIHVEVEVNNGVSPSLFSLLIFRTWSRYKDDEYRETLLFYVEEEMKIYSNIL